MHTDSAKNWTPCAASPVLKCDVQMVYLYISQPSPSFQLQAAAYRMGSQALPASEELTYVLAAGCQADERLRRRRAIEGDWGAAGCEAAASTSGEASSFGFPACAPTAATITSTLPPAEQHDLILSAECTGLRQRLVMMLLCLVLMHAL